MTPLWKFDGYVTAAGRQVVCDWFLDELNDKERDAIRDRIRYLENVPKTLWMEPAFKNFGNDFGEIRASSKRGAIRIYGQFTEEGRFLLLFGHIKKKTHDREGINTAKLRLKEFNKGMGSASEFDFEAEPSEEDSSEPGGESGPGNEQFGSGNSLPN